MFELPLGVDVVERFPMFFAPAVTLNELVELFKTLTKLVPSDSGSIVPPRLTVAPAFTCNVAPAGSIATTPLVRVKFTAPVGDVTPVASTTSVLPAPHVR